MAPAVCDLDGYWFIVDIVVKEETVKLQVFAEEMNKIE